MKERICNLLLLFVLMFIMTGCVKFEANMDIKKNGEMDFNIIYAAEESILGDESLIDEEGKQNLLDSGFKIEDYTLDSMKGIKVSKYIKDIDLVSSSNDVEYSLSGLFSMKMSGDSPIFKVKKGLFKNFYTANLIFDSSDSSLNNDGADDSLDTDLSDDGLTTRTNNYSNDEYLDNNVVLIDEEIDDETDMDGEFNTDIPDFESMINDSMDLSFNVTLPNTAISNNATEITNDGKQLKWKLTTEEISSIQFEFALYNMEVIYICIGGIMTLVILVSLVLFFTIRKRKRNNSINQNINTVQNNVSSSETENLSNTMNVQNDLLFNNYQLNNNDIMENGNMNNSSLNNVANQNNVSFSATENLNNTMNVQNDLLSNNYQLNNNNIVENGNMNNNALNNVANQSNVLSHLPSQNNASSINEQQNNASYMNNEGNNNLNF